MKWFLDIYIAKSHKKGISSLQLSRDIDITQKSSWFMLQRIRNFFDLKEDEELDNYVEIDATFVGGKNRHTYKKVKNSQGRSFKDKKTFLGMLERKEKLIAIVINDTIAETFIPEIIKRVKTSASLLTYEWLGYNSLKRFYDHAFVKHNEGESVKGRIYTNAIEGFWSLLKRGIFGIYHSTTRKHLQRYVD